MGSRKKSRPNTQEPPLHDSRSEAQYNHSAAASTSSTPEGSGVLRRDASNDSKPESLATSSSATPPATPGTQTPKGKKWLSGTGSWRSKAPAIVKTATESIGISVSGGAAGELSGQNATKLKDDSPKKFLTKRKSSKGDAIPASITQISVSSDGLVDATPKVQPSEVPKEPEPPTPNNDEPPLPPEPPRSQVDATTNTWGWRSWWSRPDGYSEADKARSETQGSVQDAQSTPLPGPTPSEEPDIATKGLGSGDAITAGNNTGRDVEMKDAPPATKTGGDTDTKDAPSTISEASKRLTSGGSWFWKWSKAQNAQTSAPPVTASAPDDALPKVDQVPEAAPEDSTATQASQQPLPSTEAAAPTNETVQTTGPTASTSKPSAWAFWYREKPEKGNKPADGGAQKHVGEVAVMDTPSQSRPEAAQFNEQEQHRDEVSNKPQQPPREEPVSKKSFSSLRGRPKAKATTKDTLTDTPSSSSTATSTKASPILEPTRPETAPAAQPAPKQATKVKEGPKNLVLPEFKTTYQLVQQPGFWKQVRQYFLGGEPAAPHLHINPAPPRIKKAVAIGIHGFFPAPIIQKVLGQPTGTSIRFANAAATAIKDWSEARGYSPEIEQIALEGEGFVAERVNALWKLLLNWIDHIKAADFILVACHSQGVPVAMMLIAKLIQFGCVSATRIGVCAMAGVNMGPFIEYRTKYFGPTAAELFEFSNPKSLVSQMYLAALDEVLRFGVRILYVGSIDDQLVSLEVRHHSLSYLHCS
jgi:hypothetical protein